jgi:hypothetical protein
MERLDVSTALRHLIKHQEGRESALTLRQQRDLLKAVAIKVGLPFEYVGRLALLGPQRGLTPDLCIQINLAIDALASENLDAK